MEEKMTATQYKKRMLTDAFEKRLMIPTEQLEVTDQACANCQEALIFALQVGDQMVSIDLSTILICLKVAEIEGYIPEIDKGKKISDETWWGIVRGLYQNVNIEYEKI